MHQKLPQQETATPQTLYQGVAQFPTYVVEAGSIEASKNQLAAQTTHSHALLICVILLWKLTDYIYQN